MTTTFNSELLTVARTACGMTQEEVAQELSVSQGKVAKWETNILVPSAAEIDLMAVKLGYSPEFFTQSDGVSGFGSCCLYHRKRKSLSVKTLTTIHAQINVMGLRIARLLRSFPLNPLTEMPRLDVDEYGTAESVAQTLRATWRMPFGPVKNLVSLIEDAGGIVVKCDFGTRELDAVSLWPRCLPPLFFMNDSSPADRQRFSLAHELGHIVMHRVPPPEQEAERQADVFASEFLIPAKDFAGEVSRVTLAEAQRHKAKWRVSMQSIIEKAHSLGLTSDRHRRTLYMQLSQLGYRLREPGAFPSEEPTAMKQLIELHRQQLGYSETDLATATFCRSADDFASQFGKIAPRFGRDSAGPKLRIAST